MIPMYTKADLDEFFATRNAFNLTADKLEKRVNAILVLILDLFKVKLDWWSYRYYGGESDVPPLPTIEEDDDLEDQFSWHVCIKGNSEKLATEEWDYGDGFPIKFLFMTDDEIKQIVSSDIEETLKLMSKEKEQQKIYREKQKELNKKLMAAKKQIKKELGIK